jgi:hypothetical protein
MGESTSNYLQEWAAVLQVYIRNYTTYCTETNVCATELKLAVVAVSSTLDFRHSFGSACHFCSDSHAVVT